MYIYVYIHIHIYIYIVKNPFVCSVDAPSLTSPKCWLQISPPADLRHKDGAHAPATEMIMGWSEELFIFHI